MKIWWIRTRWFRSISNNESSWNKCCQWKHWWIRTRWLRNTNNNKTIETNAADKNVDKSVQGDSGVPGTIKTAGTNTADENFDGIKKAAASSTASVQKEVWYKNNTTTLIDKNIDASIQGDSREDLKDKKAALPKTGDLQETAASTTDQVNDKTTEHESEKVMVSNLKIQKTALPKRDDLKEAAASPTVSVNDETMETVSSEVVASTSKNKKAASPTTDNLEETVVSTADQVNDESVEVVSIEVVTPNFKNQNAALLKREDFKQAAASTTYPSNDKAMEAVSAEVKNDTFFLSNDPIDLNNLLEEEYRLNLCLYQLNKENEFNDGKKSNNQLLDAFIKFSNKFDKTFTGFNLIILLRSWAPGLNVLNYLLTLKDNNQVTRTFNTLLY